MELDPREPTTWTDLSDHPVFDAALDPTAWSSQPEVYESQRLQSFMPEWYGHSAQPRDPAEGNRIARAQLAGLRDIAIAALEIEGVSVELFVLDDLTTFVEVKTATLSISSVYPHDDKGDAFLLFVDVDSEHELEYQPLPRQEVAEVLAAHGRGESLEGFKDREIA